MFSLVEGLVIDSTDPQQMGRVKVWIPAVDGDGYDPRNLPWARYISPLAGQTRDYPAGPDGSETPGLMSYGFWAVPKVGARVLVGFLYDDVNQRVYLGSYFNDSGNRSLPVGRNRPDLGVTTPLSDTFDPVQPQTTNLQAQFGGNVDAPQARTRGAYERQAGQDRTDKDGTEGYQPSAASGGDLDPQTYCLTTPGRHSLIFQDHPTTARVRIKTAAGAQVILDDANERIYISTAKGKTWLELDQDGHVHLHAAESISIASGADLNLIAVGAINMQAGKAINIGAGEQFTLSACGNLSMTGDGGMNLTSGSQFDILAAAELIQTGSNIHLNGKGATAASCVDLSSAIIPQHEPWQRPASKSPRGKNWKE